LEETENFLDEFLKKANYCSKSAIDLVIVTGNAARLPMIQTLLTDRFGENVAFCLGDFVVEKGLALIASVLNDTTCGSYWSVDAAIQKILSEKEYKEDSKKSDSLKYVLSGVQGSCYNKRLKAYVEKTGFRIVLETYSDTWDHVVSETELYSSDTCFSSEQLHERICQAYLDRMLLSMKLSYTDITEEMTAAAVQYADCVLARGAQFVSYDAINFRENWIVPLQDAYDFVDVSIALHLPIDDLVNKILIPLNAVIGKLHQDSCRFEVDIVGDFPCAGLLEKAFTDKKLYLAACEDIVFCMLDVSAVSIRLIGTDIGMPYSSCMKDRSEWSHTSIWEDVYAEILEEKQYLCQVYGNSLPDIKLKRRNMQNYLEEMFEKNSVTIEGVEITVDDFIIHSRKHLQMLSDKIQELSKQNPSSKIVVTGDMLKLQSIRHMFEHDFHDKVIIKSLDELNEIGQNFVNRKRVVNELQKMYLI